MAVFALTGARPGQDVALEPQAFDAPPTSFTGAIEAGWDDAWQTRNLGVRGQRLRQELQARRRRIEDATGAKLPASDAEIDLIPGTGRPGGVVSDAAYEAQIEDLRRKHPDKLADVETRAQLLARIDADLKAVRTKAGQASADHPIGGFLGSAAGALADPPNLIASIATGGVGAGRALAVRMAAQGAANAGIELAEVPGRALDAQIAGPGYGADEAVADVLFAAAGGAGFEALGAGLKAGAKRVFRASADPAERGAAYVVDQLDREEAIFRGLDGLTHEEGLDALTKGQPRPQVEPARELGDLFDEAEKTPSRSSQGFSSAEYYGRTIEHGAFDPRELEVDPQRFQYKADADAAGVTARLKGVDAWDPTSSGKVIVFEQRDGARFIADGHQRRALALRMDEKGFEAKLDGYLFREADGWTARQVRTIAALKNIREGSGTILDAAKIFRDAPEALNDRSLPVTGEFISQARALARLHPEAFGAVVNKVIPERYAAEIGAIAGGRPDLHPALVKLLKQGEPGNVEEARALVSEAMLDDWVKTEGEQADFFGDLPPESTTIARAKVKASVVNALRKDAKIYGQLVKHADAIEAGGNVLLRDANETAAAINRTALEVLSRLALRSGELGEAMAAAAREVLDGKRPADAARGIVQMVRNRLAAGEDLAGVRAVTLDPQPPSPAAAELLAGVDDPKTWEKAALEAPEDEHPPAGLFDDLDEIGAEEEAHQALTACIPAPKVEAAE